MPLTDPAIRNAKAREKPYKLTDERSMYLFVTPHGAKSFRLKYRHQGRARTLTLGLYPDVSLRRAREKRDEARRLIADGIDPTEQRRAERAAAVHTFKAIAEEWLAKQSKILAPETVSLITGRLVTTLYPALGARPITDIRASDLLRVLRRLEDRGIHETAHRVRSLFGRVARYAIATGRADRDITADLKGALTPVAVTNFAAVTEPRRICELLRAIDGYQGQPSTEYALRIAPYVFVRPGELRAAEWTEFDLEAAEWRIPAQHTKMRREHLVPLAAQVVVLLRELNALTGDAVLLFPSLTSISRSISDNSMNAALRRLGFGKDEMTAHGFRSMASTRLNELGFHPDLIELQLAHAERNKVRGAYNKAQRLEERRNMMQAWADYLDGLRAGGKIIAIKRLRR
jgi:integrase